MLNAFKSSSDMLCVFVSVYKNADINKIYMQKNSMKKDKRQIFFTSASRVTLLREL